MKTSNPLKWHGGKSYLAQQIIDLMPPHTRYCEPFFGGGAVLFRKPCECVSEYVNDLNRELIDFWQVLSQTPDRMLRALWGTPFSPEIWDNATKDLADTDRVKRATAFFVRFRQSRQGLGKDFATPTSRTRRGMNENVSAWLSAVEGLPAAHERLKRVEIWSVDALDFIRRFDSKDTLFYCDPPYLHETRQARDAYDCEMTEAEHAALLELLGGIRGKFILSGYPSNLYHDSAERYDWSCKEIAIDNKASGQKSKPKKTECLWYNFHPLNR